MMAQGQGHTYKTSVPDSLSAALLCKDGRKTDDAAQRQNNADYQEHGPQRPPPGRGERFGRERQGWRGPQGRAFFIQLGESVKKDNLVVFDWVLPTAGGAMI